MKGSGLEVEAGWLSVSYCVMNHLNPTIHFFLCITDDAWCGPQRTFEIKKTQVKAIGGYFSPISFSKHFLSLIISDAHEDLGKPEPLLC